MNENFGKPARTEVCLRHAARTGVCLRHAARIKLRQPKVFSTVTCHLSPVTCHLSPAIPLFTFHFL
ncbi:hypothetical protein [Richelia sinica]|uniref:hypothetical protein n=1 Tax=Richelia sinica TaxID=1357545 RepID=UPI001689A273|nr:hypothetical protein [Richelia sinica]MBD2664623.1 hypothetical protein [Richelia sinica FACHB-800]